MDVIGVVVQDIYQNLAIIWVESVFHVWVLDRLIFFIL